MSLAGSMKPFNEKEDNFESYCKRLNGYFKANKIPDDLKVSNFIVLMGQKAFELLENLIYPKDPSECSYEELVQVMKNHYKPPVLVERYKFYKRRQGKEETISDFIAGLKALAKTCEFGSELDDFLIRDIFVLGIKDETTRKILLTTPGLNFKIAVAIALARESQWTEDFPTQIQSTNGNLLWNRWRRNNYQSTNHSPPLSQRLRSREHITESNNLLVFASYYSDIN